ncbi:MAG: 1-deoxy-D-xylulose-5-phosphate reductoisomerase [Armatimonadota bacterium]|nr:MAG: 1-deoxy-D-xylulose-5-phosphate reductoisomerase [Armatimonadota bacterium]
MTATAISILGSTGSIGRQTLEVVAASSDRFRVVALAAARNVEALAEQARRFKPALAAVLDESRAEELADRLHGTGVRVAAGEEGLREVATLPDAAVVVGAVSGIAGLGPVLAAIDAGKRLALANKEPLVAAGSIVMSQVRRSGAEIIPVDSEHSALFQCLLGHRREDIRRLFLTASGGALRDLSLQELEAVTPGQALAHPTWQMGPKVTVDSATLMNKGLEVIEAHWLFEVAVERIEVVLHHQSIIHSLVEFADGDTLAQLSRPDMRLPIQYALGYPERVPARWGALEIAELDGLTFGRVDMERYPCLRLAYEAARRGGTAPAAMNAADEVAVEAFLAGRIGYLDIARLIERVLDRHAPGPADVLQQVVAADSEARKLAQAIRDELASR